MSHRGDMRRARKAQGYDERPVPRCVNCMYYVARKVSGRRDDNTKLVAPPVCSLGGFMVKENALCNEWKSKDGKEVLE